jgi:hypothetical protein
MKYINILLACVTLGNYCTSFSHGQQIKKQSRFLSPELLKKIKCYDPANRKNTMTHKLFMQAVLKATDKKKWTEKDAAAKGYSFDQANNFSRGELVVVKRSDGSFTYGIVLDQGAKQTPSTLVQVEHMSSKDLINSRVGKIIVPVKYQAELVKNKTKLK